MSFEVGFVGLGKLGLPVSVAMAEQGNHVVGYDADERKRDLYREGRAREATGSHEPDIDARLANVRDGRWTVADGLVPAVGQDIVFVAVPTPSRADGKFDTSHVEEAVEDIGRAATADRHPKVVAVISTVLPGTMRNAIAPRFRAHAPEAVGLAYNPSFIAMGSTIEDFLHPEFVLIGDEDSAAGDVLRAFYELTLDEFAPVRRGTWEDAEVVKMCYNTYIGAKIGYANAIMELCHHTPGAHVDFVSETLQRATDRIASGAYLRGGMGDGGGCHPRDNRALAAYAYDFDISANVFDYNIQMREKQTRWLAGLAAMRADEGGTPLTVMGARYKPESNLTLDSPSLLLADYLDDWGFDPLVYDPATDYDEPPPAEPHTFVVTLDAPFVHEYGYPDGSTVIDVWRCLDLPDSVDHVEVGVGDEP